MRLDVYLFEHGYAESRARAKFLLMENAVTVDGKTGLKPSFDIDESIDHEVIVEEACPFVSVGGMKLKAALDRFAISPKGAVCVDIGASTGGFTDCLLAYGAEKVYAIDSGTSQLHEKLKDDRRVISMENTNARYVTAEDLGEAVDLAVCDVSFISQKLILGSVKSVLRQGGVFVTLIKPQFELDRKKVGRGVVTDAAHRAEAIYGVVYAAAEEGLTFRGITVSPVSGGGISDEKAAKRGNREYLAYFEHTKERTVAFTERQIKEFVKNENGTDTATWNQR